MKHFRTAVLLLATFVLGSAKQILEGSRSQEFLEIVLRHEFDNAIRTGEVGQILQEVSQKLDLASMLKQTVEWETKSKVYDPLLCTFCNAAVAELIYLVDIGTEPQTIIDSIVNLCVTLRIANLPFCDGIINSVEPQLYYILTNRHLTGKDVCGMVLVGQGCNTDNPEREWEVQIPEGTKPPVVDPVLPSEGSPTMKVLHLADTHFDPEYLPGSNAECEENYFCCRAESGPLDRPEAAAGKWGDYRNCDSPQWLLQAIYDHVMTTHNDIDFIIWTGDLIPHIIWNTTRQNNLEIIRENVQMIADSFPGIPVFPAIGNHESDPVNSFPLPYIHNEFDIAWLYDEITDLWATWLPEDVAESVAYSAYYSTPIKPGLRVVSVNSNYCYGFNWWLLYDDIDPASELDWMAKELKAAEEAGEKVYLISHIPPGHPDCTKTWSHQYNRIVLRFESTIAGLFYGHTHNDHYQVFYDPVDTTRAYHVGYIAPSQTPYTNLNPGYRIYTIDGNYEGSSYQVLDHETWIMDLDEANLSDEPRFFKLYSAKESYEVENLFPSTWSDLVFEMSATNSTLFDKFYKYYVKDARPFMEQGCDEKCKYNLLCRLMVSDNSDHSHCDDL